jgi:2-iminobutanoate/2-iminopropanoate deaminase
MPRRSIEISSFKHVNPIPTASRVGPLLVSSVIGPRDPGGGDTPDDVGAQLTNLFHHVGEMLAAADADWRHVAKMNFYVADIAVRDAINGPWVEHFPDPASRPARHTQVSPTAGRAVVDFWRTSMTELGHSTHCGRAAPRWKRGYRCEPLLAGSPPTRVTTTSASTCSTV